MAFEVTEDVVEAVRGIVGSRDLAIASIEAAAPLIEAKTRAAAIEKCAQVADNFSCGSCGMDGKVGVAIRSLSATCKESLQVQLASRTGEIASTLATGQVRASLAHEIKEHNAALDQLARVKANLIQARANTAQLWAVLTQCKVEFQKNLEVQIAALQLAFNWIEDDTPPRVREQMNEALVSALGHRSLPPAKSE